jgi:hypothetical protein
MHININLIWIAILAWFVLVMFALSFNAGAHRNRFKGE